MVEMIEIIRGTTPVIECNSEDVNFDLIENVWVTFTSGDSEVHFSYAKDEVDVSDNKIRVTLTQEQTLGMTARYYALTIRVLYSNGATMVNERYVRMYPVAKGGVINAEN